MPPRRLFRWSSGLILLSLVVDPGRAFQASPPAPAQLTAQEDLQRRAYSGPELAGVPDFCRALLAELEFTLRRL